MRIGEIARQAGLAPSTIRFYEKAGVLSAPERTPSGYRDYEPAILDRLSFIRDGQAVGLTLGELREIMAFRERGEVPCVHVIELIRRRAGEIASQIDKLQDMRRDLQLLSDRAQIWNRAPRSNLLKPTGPQPAFIPLIRPGTTRARQNFGRDLGLEP